MQHTPSYLHHFIASHVCFAVYSGTVSYDEFLVGVRGQLTARRRAIVQVAFNVLDKDRSGRLSNNIGLSCTMGCVALRCVALRCTVLYYVASGGSPPIL